MSFSTLQERAATIMSKYNYGQMVCGMSEDRLRAFYDEHRAELEAVQTKEECIEEINRHVSATQWISVDVVSWIGLTDGDIEALWQLFVEWRRSMN